MKSTFILAVTAALASLTSAQDGLPSCAKTCTNKFTSTGGGNIGGCKSLDIQCICSSPTFLSDIACCLTDQCNAADQATAVQFAQNICKTSGVTNLPSAVTCASSAAPSSSSSAASDSSSAATGATTTATTASGSSSSPAASGGSASSAVAGSATSKTGGSSTSSSASAATAAPSSNAGHQKETGFGAGVLGGLAAVVALL
ncbi:CFEM domain-containing protein [Rutstroemia sp. NJR-2017a BBW]|nr:CFEM domain-containing protein [Rutstroemia sp. NJR-2017a BBW]PQE08613.1 CFEM domain-containing protein [Rutstroemia sp. NJR-2017a BBW]